MSLQLSEIPGDWTRAAELRDKGMSYAELKAAAGGGYAGHRAKERGRRPQSVLSIQESAA